MKQHDTSMNRIGINNVYLMTHSNDWKPVLSNLLIQDGIIAEIRKEPVAQSEDVEILDGKGMICMPGLVNAHCHGDMTLARGFGDNMTLFEQDLAFRKTGWFYDLISDEDRFASRQLTYAEALLSGTTFLLENMYWTLGEKSVQAMKEIGIDGALVEDVRYDFSRPDEMLPLSEIQKRKGEAEDAGFQLVAGSLAEEHYETERLKKIHDLCEKAGIRQTLHLAESDWRMKIAAEKFGTTPVRYLASHGFLTPGTIASHVVHVDEEDIRLLAENRVSVANTPVCEMKITDGIAPIAQMVKTGVNVCLGTDGALWDNTNDLFREMKGMSLLQSISFGIRSLKTSDILDMATINGAKAFGLENQMGDLKTGMLANLILIDASGPRFTPFITGEHENLSSHLIYNATGSDVAHVFVRGRHVVDNHTLMTADLTSICDKVQKIGEKIAKNGLGEINSVVAKADAVR